MDENFHSLVTHANADATPKSLYNTTAGIQSCIKAGLSELKRIDYQSWHCDW